MAGASTRGIAFSIPPSRTRWLEDPILAVLAIWLVIAAWTVTWGASHLPRYWHACFVPLFWLSAQGLYLIAHNLARYNLQQRVVVGVMAATVLGLLLEPPVRRQAREVLATVYYANEDSDRRRLAEIAAEVRRRTRPEEEIYVWGFQPGIYRFSNRFAPCRFCELGKLLFLGPSAQFMVDEVTDALNGRTPKLILLSRSQLCEIQTGRQYGADVTALKTLLDARYRRAAEVQEQIVFERIDPPVEISQPEGRDRVSPAA